MFFSCHHQYTVAIHSKPFPTESFTDYLLDVYLSSKISSFLAICCFLCVKHIQDVFSMCFFYLFWTLSNRIVAVTTDTCSMWLPLPLLQKNTLYCCNKVSCQMIFATNVEFFLPFFNCSQLFSTFSFYKKIFGEKRKKFNTKSIDNKTFLFEISRRLQNKVFVSANNLFISTPNVHLNHQFICKTQQKQEQWLWGVLNTSPRPHRGCFWKL